MSIHPALCAGRAAVITGGAGGIGLAVATKLAAEGMAIALADKDEQALAEAAASLPGQVQTYAFDVSDAAAFTQMAEDVAAGMPPVGLLFNNAGASLNPGHCWEKPDVWAKQVAINYGGILNGVQAFVPAMVAAGQPALVVNTGSKQGMTLPPGNYAYNVSKAAVIAFTECLAHDLRENAPHIAAHLLVPGFTYSRMISDFIPEKPPAAWTCEQVADYMLEHIALGDFYILCPDNDVTREMDEKRIQWDTDDILQNRPALSRWHKDYEGAFAAFMES